jgi:hypothetical protein
MPDEIQLGSAEIGKTVDAVSFFFAVGSNTSELVFEEHLARAAAKHAALHTNATRHGLFIPHVFSERITEIAYSQATRSHSSRRGMTRALGLRSCGT